MKRRITRAAVLAGALMVGLVIRGRAPRVAPPRADRPHATSNVDVPADRKPGWSPTGWSETTSTPTVDVTAPRADASAGPRWLRGLREEVCACPDAACATRAQHAYAERSGTIDFSSGDPEEQRQLMQAITACTARLLEGEPADSAG